MKLPALAGVLFGAGLAWAQVPPATVVPPILDFMVMDVCVDAQDRVLDRVRPGDAACTRHRDIRVGETPGYALHNHVGEGKGCASELGNVAKQNLPVRIGRVTRVVSSYDKGSDPSCGKQGAGVQRFGDFDAAQEGASIQWHDSEYAFIMGSWSPVSQAHWLTPGCARHPNDSRRFFRGWVVASVDGRPGYLTSESKIVVAAPGAATPCPSRYSRSFTYWFQGAVRFTDGQTRDAIVSSHYSRASRSGMGPGAAEQLERTYWTREFGMLRWEKWARQDWIHPRNQRPATEMARHLRSTQRCSPPVALPGQVSTEFEARSLPGETGSFAEEQRTAGARAEVWLMTACNDFSRPTATPAGQAPIQWEKVLNPAYWRE